MSSRKIARGKFEILEFNNLTQKFLCVPNKPFFKSTIANYF